MSLLAIAERGWLRQACSECSRDQPVLGPREVPAAPQQLSACSRLTSGKQQVLIRRDGTVGPSACLPARGDEAVRLSRPPLATTLSREPSHVTEAQLHFLDTHLMASVLSAGLQTFLPSPSSKGKKQEAPVPDCGSLLPARPGLRACPLHSPRSGPGVVENHQIIPCDSSEGSKPIHLPFSLAFKSIFKEKKECLLLWAAMAGAQDTRDLLITSDVCTGPRGHRSFLNHHPPQPPQSWPGVSTPTSGISRGARHRMCKGEPSCRDPGSPLRECRLDPWCLQKHGNPLWVGAAHSSPRRARLKESASFSAEPEPVFLTSFSLHPTLHSPGRPGRVSPPCPALCGRLRHGAVTSLGTASSAQGSARPQPSPPRQLRPGGISSLVTPRVQGCVQGEQQTPTTCAVASSAHVESDR